jgi:putative peptidoglycan lipid II flippase
LARIGVPFRPTLDLGHPGVRKVFRMMLPVVLGLSLPGIYSLVLQYFATFYPTGVNTALDQANRLMQAPLGVFGQALALAAFPALSQFRALGQMDMFRDQLVRSMRQTVYLALPAAVLLGTAPLLVVRALYQHGKFDALAAQRTASILQWCAVGVVAWCLHPVLMRAYYALQKNVKPIVLGTVATAVFVAGCWALLQFECGYPLLGVTGAVAATVLVALLLADLRRELGGLDLRPLGRTLGLSALACVPAGAVAFAAQAWALSADLSAPAFVATAAAAVLAFAWAYAGATLLFRMEEADLARRALRRLGRR